MNPYETFKDQLANGATLLTRGGAFVCRKGEENIAMAINHGWRKAAPAPIESLAKPSKETPAAEQPTDLIEDVPAKPVKRPRKPRTKK